MIDQVLWINNPIKFLTGKNTHNNDGGCFMGLDKMGPNVDLILRLKDYEVI